MTTRLQYGILAAAVALGMAGAQERPAAAKTHRAVSPTACNTDSPFKPASANYWSFSVDFGDGSTDGCLMVTGQTADEVNYYPIACTVVGAVPVNNGAGEFDGGGYLACDVDWQKYTPGIKPLMIYTDGFQMKAAVSKLAGSQSLTVGNPLIHHASVSYYAPRSAEMNGFARHRFTSLIGASAAVSDLPATPIGSAFAVRSLSNCSFALFVYNCKLRHHYNGAQVQQWSTNNPVKFDTTQRRFYVGYSPVVGAGMLKATLDYVIVDPQAGKGT